MGVGSFILPQIEVFVEYTISEWQRPSDWLPMPTNITSADQIFVGLHAVIENSDNYCAFSFTTSSGQYQVDWGDEGYGYDSYNVWSRAVVGAVAVKSVTIHPISYDDEFYNNNTMSVPYNYNIAL